MSAILLLLRVIFLDVDGVLNSGSWLMRETPESVEAHKRTDLPPCADDIDPSKVALLQRMVDETGAVVVISSNWRYQHGAAGMAKLLAAHGFKGQVVGATARDADMIAAGVPRTCRGDEIALWLSQHPEVEDFTILDDNEHMGDLDWKLVRTDFEVGLTEADTERAIAMLRGDGEAP